MGHIGTELSPATIAVSSSGTTGHQEQLSTCNENDIGSSTFIMYDVNNGTSTYVDDTDSSENVLSENSGLELQTNISSDSTIVLDGNNLPNVNNSSPHHFNFTNYVQGNPYNLNATFSIGNELYNTEWEFLEAYSQILDEEFGYSSDSSSSELIPLPFLPTLFEETEDDLSDELSAAELVDPYDHFNGRIFEAASGTGAYMKINGTNDIGGPSISIHNYYDSEHGTFDDSGNFHHLEGPSASSEPGYDHRDCPIRRKTKQARAQGDFFDCEYHTEKIGAFEDVADGAYIHGFHDCYEQFPDGLHTPDVSEDGDFIRAIIQGITIFLSFLWRFTWELNLVVLYNALIFFIVSISAHLSTTLSALVYPLFYSLLHLAGIRNFFIGIGAFFIHRLLYHILFCPVIYISYLVGSSLFGHKCTSNYLSHWTVFLDSFAPGNNTRRVTDFLMKLHSVNYNIPSDVPRTDDEFGFLAKSLCVPREYDRFFSSLFLLITSFDNAKNNRGRGAACVSFIMHQTEGGIITMAESTATFIRCCQLAFVNKVQSSASFDEVDAFLTGLTKLTASDRYVGVVNLVSLLSCSVLFGSSALGTFANNHNLINKDIQKAASGMSTDRLFIDISRSVLNLMKSFVGIPKGPGLVTNTTQLHATIYELMSNIKNRGLTPESPGMPTEVFSAKLFACDKFIREFLMSNPSQAAKIAMGSAIKEVQNLNAMFRRSAMDTARSEPFNIYLTGKPGTGKTELAIRLGIAACVKLGYHNPTAENVYFKNASKWWDGYDPTKHWIVIIDEIANLKHGPAGDAANMETFQGLLAMLSASQYLTEQAEAFNKSAVPFMAAVVVCMSNRIDLGAPHYLESLKAFYRRANIMLNVESVKPEFATKAVIDHSKVPKGERNIVNINVIELNADNSLSPMKKDGAVMVLNNDESVFHITRLSEAHRLKIISDKERRGKITPVALEELQIDLDKMNFLTAGPCDIVVSGWDMLCVSSSCTFRIFVSHALMFLLTTASSALKVFIEDERNVRHQRIVDFFMPTITKSRNIWKGVNEIRGSTWNLAHEIQRQSMKDYQKYAVYVGVFTGIVSASVVYKWIKNREEPKEEIVEAGGVSMSKPTFSILSIGTPPTPPVTAAARNIWVKEEHFIPWGKSGSNHGSLSTRTLNATYAIVKGSGPKSIMMNALNVRGQYFIFPMHFKLSVNETPDEMIRLMRYVGRPQDSAAQSADMVMIWEGFLHPSNSARVCDDTQMVEIKGTSPGKDLFPYFLKTMPETSYPVGFNSDFYAPYRTYLGEDKDGAVLLNDCGSLTIGKVTVSNPLEDGKTSEFMAYRGKSSHNCFFGRCGTSAIISNGKQGAIAGILIAGVVGQDVVVFSIVTLEGLERAYALITNEFEMPSGVEMAGALCPFGLRLVNPVRMHHIQFAPPNPFIFHGILDRATNSTMKSSVVIHPESERIKRIFGFKTTYSPPKFTHSRDSDGNYICQEKHMLTDLINHSQNVHPSLLQHARASMLDKFLDNTKKSSVKIYDVRTAVNGTYYIALNGMRKSAGVGFPYPGKKGEYFVLSPTEDNPLSVMPNHLILEEMDYILGEFRAGRRVNSVYQVCFKDEAMKKDKAELLKNRGFSGCPTALLILMRMYMGPLLDIISKDPVRFETVAGINVFSKQWKEMYADILKFPNGVSSDYKRYDKSMPSFIQQEVYGIILSCIKHFYLDWTDEDSKVFNGLACESMYPIYLLDACLIEVAGSVPSGILFTLIVNGMCQGVLHRSVFRLMVEPQYQFNDHVVLLTMGDDGSQSISDDVIEKYNLISETMIHKAWGITITGSNKEEGMIPCHPISESSICKRSIRIDEDTGLTMCPIEWESIGKMITTGMEGGPLHIDKKFALSYEAAISEFAMYGEACYRINVPKLLKLAEEFGYKQYMEHILSYEEVIARFRKASLAPHVQCEDDE